MLDFIIGIDVELMYFLNVTLHNPFFNWYMPLFHNGDNWRIPLIIMWVLLMIFGGKRGRWAGLGGALILALSDPISSHVIKPLVGRIRPCNVLGGLWLYRDGAWLLTPEVITKVYKGSLSFTSSHAANTFGQAIYWSLLYPKTRWFWWIMAFSIGYSRIYDGVHYPFDVLGGWAVGAGCFAVVWFVGKKWGPEMFRGGVSSKTFQSKRLGIPPNLP